MQPEADEPAAAADGVSGKKEKNKKKTKRTQEQPVCGDDAAECEAGSDSDSQEPPVVKKTRTRE